jgi:hypothetical protein
MKESRISLLIFLIPVILGISEEIVFSQDNALNLYEYLSPKPYSLCHNPETMILIRFGEEIDISSLKEDLFDVTGDISGSHQGRFTISRDHLTLIFKPDSIFSLNEKVTLRLQEGIKTISGKLLPLFNYWFTIRQQSYSNLISVPEGETNKQEDLSERFVSKKSVKGVPLSFADFDFPKIRFSNNPAEGNIMTTLTKGSSDYIYIFDNKAVPVYARIMPHEIINLRPHHSGKLTYYDNNLKGFIVLDSSMAPVDTLFMKNNYRTDSHDILLLKNGHFILFAIDPMIVDMSKIIAGGNPVATVNGLVIQELDEGKNMIFQWRSWDYFNITDSYTDLNYSVVDYVHGNSIDADTETTLILSSRNLNEVTKINRSTGQIIWRLGGKNNEFIFEDDPRQFAGQHTAIKQKNGTLTLFDNGVGLSPQYSRGVEYEIDEINKRVKLIHEFRYNPDVYAHVSGNLQRLDNGNTFIYWGSGMDNSEKLFCEYDVSGNIIFEARFGMTINLNFRAYRSTWKTEIFTLSADTLSVESVIQNAPIQQVLTIKNKSKKDLIITSAYHNDQGFSVKDLPKAIEAGNETTVTVEFPSFEPGVKSDDIIFCMETDSVIVTKTLFVSINNFYDTGIENNFQSVFKVSPNPGNGDYYVEIKSPGRYALKILDLSGKTIWGINSIESGLYHIDLVNKPDGLYLLSLEELSTGKIHTTKLIKQ